MFTTDSKVRKTNATNSMILPVMSPRKEKLALHPPVFYLSSNSYLFKQNEAIRGKDLKTRLSQRKKKTVVNLPLVVDTEFQTLTAKHRPLLESLNLGSLTISIQIKPPYQDEGLILNHWDMKKAGQVCRYPLVQTDFAVIDYLTQVGYSASLRNSNGTVGNQYYRAVSKKRVLRVVLFAHFAVADIARLFKGELKADYLELNRRAVRGSQVKQKRRLTTEYRPSKSKITKEFVRFPWIVELEGIDYALEIAVIDSGALHGNASLKDLACNTGTPLDDKDVFTRDDKSDMLTQYNVRFEDFHNYSLGDLVVYDILENNANLFREVYESLGLQDYFTVPKLTIGATVTNLFIARISKLFADELGRHLSDEELQEIIESACIPGSSNELIKRETNTGGLNAKVLGGRCYNNRPRDTIDTGVVTDTDISGCYGEGMRNQLYPFGKPVIIDYPKNSKTNKYLSLRDFLKQNRKELVPGLWQLWFTVTKPLPTAQDYFSSYEPPKHWQEIKADTEKKELEETQSWLEYPDDTKIFSHEITNGLLTHDGLQWLENVCSKSVREFILDNSIVITAMYYPASDRVNNPIEFLEKLQSHSDENTSEASKENGNTIVTNVDRECKAWFAVNLGDFLVTELLLLRKQHPKKSPMNTMYKLCINTLYGDMVSKYFKTSNVVVGNNITARARALAWCMEKALYTHNSITDGGAFNLNRVAYGRNNRVLNDRNSTQTNRLSYRELKDLHVKYGAIGSYDSIEWYEDTNQLLFTKSGKTELLQPLEALNKINNLIADHLRLQFPKLDILNSPSTDIKGNPRIGQFGFESKNVVRIAVFHGQSNYLLKDGFNEKGEALIETVAMRSYEKSKNSPAAQFLRNVLNDAHNVPRQSPFTSSQVVKVGDYKQRFNSYYSTHNFDPGDSIEKAGLLRELSLSQFTFNSKKQRDSWEKYVTRLKDHVGQSVEGYFINPENDCLDYQAMIEAVDRAIEAGAANFREWIDRHYNSPGPSDHPQYGSYMTLKESLKEIGLYRPDLEARANEWDLDLESDPDSEYDFTPGILLEDEDIDFDW